MTTEGIVHRFQLKSTETNSKMHYTRLTTSPARLLLQT